MFLYEMIYPEIALSQDTVYDLDGIQWGGPGRKGQDAPADIDTWKAWKNCYIKQYNKDFTKIPMYVNDYYQKAKFFSAPPSLQELDFTLILDRYGIKIEWGTPKDTPKVKKEKPFVFSQSAINAFINCPYAFAETRIFKRVKRLVTKENTWGNDVHEALAKYLEGGPVTELVKPHLMYAQALRNCPRDELLVEKELAIDKKMQPCGWWDDTVWFRGKVDAGIIKGDWCKIWDWKTGKRTEDFFELKVFCFLLALHYPKIKRFEGAYIFLKEDNPEKAVVNMPPLTREDLLGVWGDIQPKIKRIEDALVCNIYPKKKSGLCRGWCPCEDCEHWEEKRR